MSSIVIVEDNDFIREAIAGYLTLNNHRVYEFSGVEGVVPLVGKNPVDLMILDVMLPDGNGFELARKVRAAGDIPLMFLTAKDSEFDRILGFEIGADDYVVKPFSSRELILRVEALLKRCSRKEKEPPCSKSASWSLEGHTLSLEEDKHRIILDGAEVHLTGAEWKILLFLAERSAIVISRSRILTECLNYLFEGSERTVDTHIANLRAKLGGVDWIGTVRGFGYRFNGVTGDGEA